MPVSDKTRADKSGATDNSKSPDNKLDAPKSNAEYEVEPGKEYKMRMSEISKLSDKVGLNTRLSPDPKTEFAMS